MILHVAETDQWSGALEAVETDLAVEADVRPQAGDDAVEGVVPEVAIVKGGGAAQNVDRTKDAGVVVAKGAVDNAGIAVDDLAVATSECLADLETFRGQPCIEAAKPFTSNRVLSPVFDAYRRALP